MPHYGTSLHQYFVSNKGTLSQSWVLQLGLKLLNILEKVHRAGVIFNDLKMDNIMIADQRNPLDHIVLIDFGLASMFKRRGKHLKKSLQKQFRGNMIFSSLNQLNFISTSRRDDLIGLCYMLVYLLKGGVVQFTANHLEDQKEAFKYIKQVKQDLPTLDLVGPPNSSTWPLLEFINQIFQLKYDEEPTY